MKLLRSSLHSATNREDAFSLTELLVVVAIVGVLSALSIPAMSSMKGAGDLTRAAYTVQDALEQARTYAMANNTYTWVGFFEEDSQSTTTTTAGKSGVGRLVICMVASQDGTSIYSQTQAKSGATGTQQLTQSRLTPISKLIKLNNVHIFDASSKDIGKRSASLVEDQGQIGLGQQSMIFSFQYPLTGTAVYTFGIRPVPSSNGNPAPSGIVQFNPQGGAISEVGPLTSTATNLEIALQSTHGQTVGDENNIVAVNVNGLTGQTIVYRP